MNSNEFISEIARRTEISVSEATNLLDGLVTEIANSLEDEDTISILGFGTFSARKKLERVVVNPTSRQRMLVPPKMVINFKASPTLKDKLKR